MKDKITWEKPDHKKVSSKDVDRLCLELKDGVSNITSTGDVRIEKSQYGRTIEWIVYRVEKVGTLTEGIDQLTRTQAIDELKKVLKQEEKGE